MNSGGIGAGGHFDPDTTGKHMGPKGAGHRGDLPLLHVDEKGNAHATLVAHITTHAVRSPMNAARRGLIMKLSIMERRTAARSR